MLPKVTQELEIMMSQKKEVRSFTADFHGNWESPGVALDEMDQGNFPELVTGKVWPINCGFLCKTAANRNQLQFDTLKLDAQTENMEV